MKLTKHILIAIRNVGWDLEEKKVATRERETEREEKSERKREGE